MNGDGRWRTQCVNPTSARPFVAWRITDGVTEYHRSTPTNYAPNGRIIRYGYQAARDKVRELNTPRDRDIQGDGRAQATWKIPCLRTAKRRQQAIR